MSGSEGVNVTAGAKFWWIVGAGVALAGLGIGYLFYDDTPIEARFRETPKSFSSTEPQAMVAWRDPAGDTEAFFPGATPPPTDAPQVLSLSRHRAEIQERLGSDTPLLNNALYVYRVEKNGLPQGVVLLRRARGEWGAIEVVVGIGSDGKIRGVRIQRHREPPDVARYLTSRAFLNDFYGKDDTHAFRLGMDSPPAPAVARVSARAVAQAVRALAIEYHVGSRP